MPQGRKPPAQAKKPRGGQTASQDLLQEIAERMQRRMDELGLDKAEVVERSGVGQSTIYNLLKAEQLNPMLSVLLSVSAALEVHIAWLIGDVATLAPEMRQGSEAVMTPVTGVADARAYLMDTAEKLEPKRHVTAHPPRDDRLHGACQFAIEVRDNHLEGINPPVTAGYVAHCVDFAQIDADVESDRVYYLIRKTGTGGIQGAFWRATVYRDRVRFAPASLDEKYNNQMAFTLPRVELFTSEEVKIAGLFYAATYEYP